jgi:nicotinamidase-related amidase
MINLDPKTTTLILIDLQKGIVGRPTQPHSGAAVLETAKHLAEKFRAAGALVTLVRVTWSDDFGDALNQPVDQPMQRPEGGFPSGWDEIADGLAQPGDLRITKRQWGAFYGTELDLQLRRRGIQTIVLGGIATNFGVESTAREAWERKYNVVIAEDATSTFSAELHNVAIRYIFPRISRIVQSAELGFSAA